MAREFQKLWDSLDEVENLVEGVLNPRDEKPRIAKDETSQEKNRDDRGDMAMEFGRSHTTTTDIGAKFITQKVYSKVK